MTAKVREDSKIKLFDALKPGREEGFEARGLLLEYCYRKKIQELVYFSPKQTAAILYKLTPEGKRSSIILLQVRKDGVMQFDLVYGYPTSFQETQEVQMWKRRNTDENIFVATRYEYNNKIIPPYRIITILEPCGVFCTFKLNILID